MKIPFTKMQTLSTDIVFPESTGDVPRPKLVEFLSKRQSGLLLDSIVFLEHLLLPNGEYIYGAKFYAPYDTAAHPLPSNEELRALGAYVSLKRNTGCEEVTVLNEGRIHRLRVKNANHSGAHALVTTELPSPAYDAVRVGLASGVPLLGQTITVGAVQLPMYAIAFEKTYAVIFDVGTPLDRLKLSSIALPLTLHPLFEKGVSAVFASFSKDASLTVRVYDRDAGELCSSGEGAAAAVAVAQFLGRVPIGRPTTVKMRGGTLLIGAKALGTSMTVTAEAHYCFGGVIEFDRLTGETVSSFEKNEKTSPG